MLWLGPVAAGVVALPVGVELEAEGEATAVLVWLAEGDAPAVCVGLLLATAVCCVLVAVVDGEGLPGAEVLDDSGEATAVVDGDAAPGAGVGLAWASSAAAEL